MNKKEKQNWIIDHFIPEYNKHKSSDYKIIDDEREKPDFIVENSRGERVGVEVTELLEDPSTVTGEQREKQRVFEELLTKRLQGHKNILVYIGETSYPAKYEELEKLAIEVAEAIINGLPDVLLEQPKSMMVRNVEICIHLGVHTSDGPHIGSSFGANSENRKRYFTALNKRIKEKIIKIKEFEFHPNVIVIYDNTKYGRFMTNIVTEVKKEISLSSFIDDPNEIWFLYGNGKGILRLR